MQPEQPKRQSPSQEGEVRPALYAVTTEVSPDAEAEWNRWMDDVHIPEVLHEPGFVSCRKWRDTASAPDGWVRYVCQYELTGLDAVEAYVQSDAAKRLRQDALTRFGSVVRVSRQVCTEVARFG